MNRPYFGRIGGKSRLAPQIFNLAPPSTNYQLYCEPLVGAGSVFFAFHDQFPNKHYIINDLNQDIYDLWKDVQDLTTRDKKQLLELDFQPNKDTFNHLRDQPRPSKRINRLHRNLYLSHHSFNTQRVYFANRPSSHSTSKRFFENLENYTKTLQHVVIKNQDYKDILKQYDHPSTLFYIDPPYADKAHYYNNQGVQTEDLLQTIQNLKGKWMLSYNLDETVEAWAREHNFTIHRISSSYTGHYNPSTKTKVKKEELLITNY